jgi:hypothetical protein
MSHRPVHDTNLPKPVGPYSPGMGFERLVFVSGQGATDPRPASSPAPTPRRRPSNVSRTCGRFFAPRARTFNTFFGAAFFCST